MGVWRFYISEGAEEDLAKLDSVARGRVLEKLKWLLENFNQVRYLPLRGRWEGFFKLRVGDWRIIYEVERKTNLIIIHCIGHRRKIYKRRSR